MTVTIKDIATRLGVSYTTVSRALRGHPYVNEELRAKIQETALTMNYHPNSLARGLRGKSTRLVGLIIPDLMNDFYASAATIIQASLAQEGYRVLLSVSGNDPGIELAYLRTLREERVDGLIWVPSKRHEQVIREYIAEGVPVVEFARRSTRQLDAVIADDLGGAQQATEYLLKTGHRRIGLVVGQTTLSTGRERLEGYRLAFQNRGIEVDERLVKTGRFERQWGRKATEELLDLTDTPTALFGTSSEIVVGMLQALDRRGLKIPDDISLIGFGDPDWFNIWRPALSTVSFATQDMALTAVSKLLQRISEKNELDKIKPVTARLSCSLVIRDSCISLKPW
jgi:DNA-binding LacI/PurR family transcriptional regulator